MAADPPSLLLLLQFILPTCTKPICLFPCHLAQRRAASCTPAAADLPSLLLQLILPTLTPLPSTEAGRFLHTGGPPPIAAIGAAGRSAPGQEEAGEAAFLKAADKAMGDLGTSGDAPFGGEVQLDPESQVGWEHSVLPKR